MEAKERVVFSYQTSSGFRPYRGWRDGFTDEDVCIALDVRITRFSTGNFGDSKYLGEGVFESRIDLGPGYRIYYGTDGDKVILLCGGDKSTQNSDFARAKSYWADYKERVKKWKDSQQSNTEKNC